MAGHGILLPADSDGWELWVGNKLIDAGASPTDLVGRRSDVVVALPASCVSTFDVTLPQVEDSLHESMVHAQIEKRGLADRLEGGTLFDFQKIGSNDEGDIFSVVVVTSIPVEVLIPTAAGYSISAAAQQVPDREACARMWKEHDRYVVGIFLNGHPVQMQLLSGKPELGKSLAGEINLLLMGLRGDPAIGASFPDLFQVVSHGEETGIREFDESLSLPVETVAAPALRNEVEPRPRLLPPFVSNARKKRRGAVRNTIILALALVVYSVIGAWIWKKAQNTKQEIASLERQVEILQPDVEHVQRAEQRWKALEPAFDKQFYPVVQLSRITSALPGSGVVIREFRTSDRSIRLRGQARDVQLANRLIEDLRAHEGFARYEWSMPNPKVEKNNTASFEIVGTPKNASTDS